MPSCPDQQNPSRSAGRARVSRALVGLLMPFPLWALAQAQPVCTPDPLPKGVAIAIGGALKNDNTEVWQRIVQEAGGAGSRFVVFATASGNPQRNGERIVGVLNAAGARAEMVPVHPSVKESSWEAVRDDPAWIAKVEAAQGVFFGGGAQELIVRALKPEGRETAMLQAVRQVQARGGVVAGTSAGAAIQSEWMFRDAQDALAVLKGRLREGKEIDRGLGFAGKDLFIDQHFLKRGRIARLLPVMHRQGYRFGLGVEENSAALIRGSHIEVIGARGALLVDLAEAKVQAQPFSLQGGVLTYLDRGDRHELRCNRTTPAAAKLAGTLLDHQAADFKPNFKRSSYPADMLGDNTIVNAMGQLLDSPDLELRGLAFNLRAQINGQPLSGDGGADPDPSLGFEFRLYKAADTRGQFTGAWGGEDYSVQRMRLDVTPIRLRQPLYEVIRETR
ncbi:cyanophycinase [Inhella sp.]|uniref:cyanophycinase n=1 Tax=Inhella sp. TaxID=1921806 RepID=UPI0035B4DDBD